MTLYALLFYFFALITVGSAFFVVSTKNVMYAAFNLMLTFFGVAGIYVLLGADFIAIVQLIVYVGGILILILFGVMLTNKITDAEIKTGVWQILPATIVVGLLFGILFKFVTQTKWHIVNTSTAAGNGLQQVGSLLMNEYIIIFELLGILLTIALIGAASIARK
jgi:NADH-quinone oxidoreductase subunit J